MTREEAIKRLKSDIYEYADFTENPNENEFWMAFDIAIKALEAPPNDNWEGYSKRLWKSAYGYGKADAEQRWIPVSERLPKNDEDVLVCYPNGGMEVVYYHIDNSIYPTEYKDSNETGWCNEEGDAIYFEPVAWMPLPEPYKAESEEV